MKMVKLMLMLMINKKWLKNNKLLNQIKLIKIKFLVIKFLLFIIYINIMYNNNIKLLWIIFYYKIYNNVFNKVDN